MLARLPAARRLPQILGVRFSSGGGVRSEGSVAQSKEFSKKEKAHEDAYVRQHEAAQLKKLSEQIKAKKAEVAELEKAHNELAQKKQD